MNIPQVNKSSRHSKITGDFGEHLVLYWLSRRGFECARVDHTGIDLIAKNPHTKELMGISVKSRSRNLGKEKEHMLIRNSDIKKTSVACRAFGCKPYFAITADLNDKIVAFILPQKKLQTLFPKHKNIYWKMRSKDLERYYSDPEIKIFEFDTKTHSWWK